MAHEDASASFSMIVPLIMQYTLHKMDSDDGESDHIWHHADV